MIATAPSPRALPTWRNSLLAALVAATALLLIAPAAQAARPLTTGFTEVGGSSGERSFLLGKVRQAKARFMRVNLHWRHVAKRKPAKPANPADPAYDFSSYDTTIGAAAARNVKVLLMVYDAPRYAEGKGRAKRALPGTWKPRPKQLRQFARAVARRYSGNFSGLPRVRHYQAWNEWTSERYLAPAWQKGKLFSPVHYRRMIRAFYAGIKSVGKRNVVVSGGTNPYGDPGRGHRIRPMRALRKFFCLQGRQRLRPGRCRKPPKLDQLDHHAINTSGGPRTGAIHPDDASSGDLWKVRRVLRKAERVGNVRPRKRGRKIWVTESWFESNPPDRKRGVPLAKQARWIQLNLYVLWKQGARYVFNIQVRDKKRDPDHPSEGLQAGLLFADNKRKPAFKAFRFPFVGDRKGKRRVVIWGKAPRAGRLQIQRRRKGGGWRTVKRVNAGNNKTFKTRIRLRKKRRGAHKLRGKVGPQTSRVWRQR